VVLAVLLALAWLVVPRLLPEHANLGMLGAVAGGALILLWWLFFSRALWLERLAAPLVMIVAVILAKRVVDPSIANGMMDNMLYVFSVPVLGLALVAWAVASRGMSSGLRKASMVAAIFVATGLFTLVRTGGVSGEGMPDFHWRWTKTPEQRLLAQTADETPIHPPSPIAVPLAPASVPAAAPSSPTPSPAGAKAPESAPTPEPPAIWPGFRGPNRDGVVRAAPILSADWGSSPPKELWRRKIGPGWSSFAVRGSLVYTQEQRGDDEDVSCYDLTTGALVWRHRDAARFWESNAGPGPRGTPTVVDGRVYTHGATGIVNALDADTGTVVWSRNAASDTGAPTPGWGFTSSPLVVHDLVIVAASGRLAAYDIASGTPRWSVKTGGGSYSSPQLMTIGGVPQVVLLNGAGATSVAPADGARLWDHAWAGVPILQPVQVSDGEVLLTSGDMMGGMGTRRIDVTHGGGRWTATERWTSKGLKPYYNDIVVHKGHAYGFDGSILACIDLENGERTWKGGRYGHGQLVLLPDQDLLLVLSEDGELALVKAAPDQFTEVARATAIEGKTWNHPALVRDVLLVRNGEEMAAFKLPVEVR